MSRLTGLTVAEIEANREGIAEEFSKRHNVTVLLKGAATVVATYDDETVYINNSGNAALATGGSGDVLSGIIGALIAQGLSAFDAACAGAFIHGNAAEIVSEDTSVAGMVASDLYAGIRKTYIEMEQ